MFVDHFPDESPVISGSLAKNDLQCKACFTFLPFCSEGLATTLLKRAILCGHNGECGILEICSENRREIVCGKRITDARSESSATTFLKCAIPCGHVGELVY